MGRPLFSHAHPQRKFQQFKEAIMAMQQHVAAGDMIHTQAVPRFYMGLIQNELKSKEAGRPIYDDIEMIEIKWAGNTKSELHAPASDRC